jgi:ATP-dependent RNA helicase DHX8/PRP22
MANSDLYSLEFLSLVAKITQEIDNHTGLNDKTLAEFVIALHDQSKTLSEFKSKLKDVGADFPESFIDNMDRLILNMHPKHKKKFAPPSNGKQNKDLNGNIVLSEQDKKKRMFPGLALADQEPNISKDVLMKEVDDLMSQFEGASKKAKARPAETDRSPKRTRRDHSRSQSPPRRRSASPPRGRDYGDRRDDRRGRGRARMDEKPVLYKIYNGKISGMKDFGAFVTIEGVAGRAEGMCLQNWSFTTSLTLFVQVWCMYQISSRVLASIMLLTCSVVGSPSK